MQWQTPDLQVSDALAEILNTMLQQLPTDRFQSARDVLDVLDDAWVVPAIITNSSIPTASIAVSNTLHSSNLSHEPEEMGNNTLDFDNLLQHQAPLDDNSFLPLDDAPLQLYQAPVEEDTYIQTNKKPWVLAGVLATGIIGIIALVIPRFLSRSIPITTTGNSIVSYSSIGERILLSNEGSRDNDKFKKLKRAGVLAIANQSYAEAVTKLQAALAENPNSPETRIYLNNALIGDRKSYTIATAAPISRSLDRASEMLRGFAQAQAEMNQVGDVNEAKIKLRIVDDSDDPKTIENIATGVVNRPEVLGIVGHNRNDVTMKAAKIYDRNKLAFIAPISTANELTSTDKPYIFRTNAKGVS